MPPEDAWIPMRVDERDSTVKPAVPEGLPFSYVVMRREGSSNTGAPSKSPKG